MRENYTLLTPENVELRYEVAGLGSRLLAAIIDYAIMSVGYLALAFAQFVVGAAVEDLADTLFPNDPRSMAMFINYAALALVVVLTFLGWWGYFVLFELLWNGQTPGKRLLRLRVVGLGGRPVGAAASLVRNLLRAIDFLLLIGVLVMLLNRSNRRLGDLAAGTLVAREPSALSRGAPAAVSIPNVATALVDALPNAGRLTMAHYSLVREYFARRSRLPPGQADALAARLTAEIARLLEVPASEIRDPATFLATVAGAFEARHRYYDAPV